MQAQLVLLEEAEAEWPLDERTRERGRRGVAAARQVLAKVAGRQAASAA